MTAAVEREMRNIRLANNFDKIDAKILDAWFEYTINKYPNAPYVKHLGDVFRDLADPTSLNYLGDFIKENKK